jgi:hypothetical protein
MRAHHQLQGKLAKQHAASEVREQPDFVPIEESVASLL